jgi:hypothetical protein
VTSGATRGYNCAMRYLSLVFVLAASLAACGDIVIGPVDHSCPTNRSLGQGSGCAEHGGGGR